MAGDQVNRRVSTGTEHIDQVPDTVLLGVEVMRVEMVGQRMEVIGRWKEVRVLRTEYFMACLAEADRLLRLSRLESLRAYLASAHAFVEGALSHARELAA